ncbi:MAG: FAD-binding oxidoreductase [Chloroflexi bacterium]|nr:FAD-binding oxidoreductase [Chloroflexota bacterium]
MSGTRPYLDELASIVGPEHLILNSSEIQKSLRDNSWLSPLLTEHIDQLKMDTGRTLRIDAVVSPNDVDQLRSVIALAVRHDIPMTARGGGTSNFGQTIPLEGGLIIDTRRLAGILELTENSITVAAGTVQGEVDRAARAQGKQLTVLTTTYASATAAGWVAGGHVGLGANAYGTIWDGNVLKVKMLTAEDPPRELTLSGEELLPVLHTYGTTGIMTEVTFPLVEAREWLEAVAVFDAFEEAVHFTTAMAHESSILQSVVTAQEASISSGFTPLRDLFEPGQALVLMIVEARGEAQCRELCQRHGGLLQIWKRAADQRKISLGLMVYGHRMLWIKKLAPEAAFLHVYFSPDGYFEQLRALKEKFRAEVWEEFKYIRSRWLRSLRGLSGDGLLPAAVLTLVSGSKESLNSLLQFCDSIGVTYLNPHTFLLEESGLFLDFQPIADFKRQTDPKGLLNPGKIGKHYFARG